MNLKPAIEELKSVIRLEDVMEYSGVELVSKTGDNWKAKCWYHDDKIPSVNISTRRGLYYCFSTGCQASGDLLSFVCQWHNLEVHEAVRWLGGEFGIDIGVHLQRGPEEAKLARLRAITTKITEACHAELLKNKEALAYLKKRGVSLETARAFKLGYSPSPAFVQKASGASAGDIKALNLVSKMQFNGRLLFPIYHQGTPAVFHSRALSRPDPNLPKYIGPYQEHPLRSSALMFGLQVARREARKDGLLLVEGPFDCLTLHSMGFTNAVSMLGSSPRPEQMEVLSSIKVPRVTVLFDPDRAGDAGVLKTIESRRGDVQVRVAFIPEGDPDEYVLKHGRAALEGVLSQSLGASDYLLGLMTDRLMSGDLAERSQTSKLLATLSSKLPGHEAALMLKELSERTGIPIDDLREATITDDDKKVVQDEVVVLAACLTDEACLLETQNKFRGQDVWLLSKHRTIWKAMLDLRAKGVSEFTPELIKEAAKSGSLNGSLDGLFQKQISNFNYHLDLVYEAAVRRALRRAGRRLSASATDPSKAPPQVLSEHLSGLSKDVTPDSSIEFTAPQQVESAMDYLHERMAAGGTIPGLDMGDDWKALVDATLGWQRGHMNLLSALPKRGKTTLAMNWTAALAVGQKRPVLWMNYEMKQRDLSLRFLSMLSGVSNRRLRIGAIGAPEKKLVDEAAEAYYSAPLYVVDAASLTLQETVNMMRKYVYDKGVECIVIDYIQLIRKSDPRLQYWEHHQLISSELKSAITTLDVPLIGISQLSKGAIEGGGAANQGGAFKYLQDCDMAMELRPRTAEEMQEDPTANLQLSIDFSRHGQQEIFFKLLMNHETLRIAEV